MPDRPPLAMEGLSHNKRAHDPKGLNPLKSHAFLDAQGGALRSSNPEKKRWSCPDKVYIGLKWGKI